MGKSSVKTYTITKTADQRTQIDAIGAGGQFVAPEATVANPGAVAGRVGDYSQLSQEFAISTQGMTGDQVRQMLADQQAAQSEAMRQVTQLSSGAIESSSAAVKSLAAGQAGGTGDWTRYVPFLVVGLVVLVLAKGGRK